MFKTMLGDVMGQQPPAAGKSRLKRIFEIVKFSMSSSAGALVDYALYVVFLRYTEMSLITSFTISRICGALVNFLINRFVVFRETRAGIRSFMTSLGKFAMLWITMYFSALGLLHLFTDSFGIGELIAKPMADAVMYIFSFFVQKFLVFRKRRSPEQTDASSGGQL